MQSRLYVCILVLIMTSETFSYSKHNYGRGMSRGVLLRLRGGGGEKRAREALSVGPMDHLLHPGGRLKPDLGGIEERPPLNDVESEYEEYGNESDLPDDLSIPEDVRPKTLIVDGIEYDAVSVDSFLQSDLFHVKPLPYLVHPDMVPAIAPPCTRPCTKSFSELALTKMASPSRWTPRR